MAAAPPAFASTMAGALNWTGITDSYGVPVGSYYLSVVSTREAITEAGPDINLNPASWFRWAGNALTEGLTHDSIATALQAQASVYIVMITLALWLLRFAMSSTWLYWLATWFRPLFDVLRNLLVELYVFPICMALGLGVGAYHLIVHGRRGSGWGIMLSTFMIGIIGIILTKDPLTELYSDNGLLNQGRNLGFTVAQAAMNNGAIAPGGTQGQLTPPHRRHRRCHNPNAVAAVELRRPGRRHRQLRQRILAGPTDRSTRRARPRHGRHLRRRMRCPPSAFLRPAPRRQQRRHRVLLLGTRPVLDHLHLLRHLQLHHGVRGRVPQRHHGPVRRRPRHDQRPPAPPRRAGGYASSSNTPSWSSSTSSTSHSPR